MYTITPDDIFRILTIVFLLLVAVGGTFFPMKVAQIITIGPKFIFPKLFGEENIPPRALRAIQLIDDPEAYADEFKAQLLLIRVMGIVAMLMFCCIVFSVTTGLMKPV